MFILVYWSCISLLIIFFFPFDQIFFHFSHFSTFFFPHFLISLFLFLSFFLSKNRWGEEEDEVLKVDYEFYQRALPEKTSKWNKKYPKCLTHKWRNAGNGGWKIALNEKYSLHESEGNKFYFFVVVLLFCSPLLFVCSSFCSSFFFAEGSITTDKGCSSSFISLSLSLSFFFL